MYLELGSFRSHAFYLLPESEPTRVMSFTLCSSASPKAQSLRPWQYRCSVTAVPTLSCDGRFTPSLVDHIWSFKGGQEWVMNNEWMNTLYFHQSLLSDSTFSLRSLFILTTTGHLSRGHSLVITIISWVLCLPLIPIISCQILLLLWQPCLNLFYSPCH